MEEDLKSDIVKVSSKGALTPAVIDKFLRANFNFILAVNFLCCLATPFIAHQAGVKFSLLMSAVLISSLLFINRDAVWVRFMGAHWNSKASPILDDNERAMASFWSFAANLEVRKTIICLFTGCLIELLIRSAMQISTMNKLTEEMLLSLFVSCLIPALAPFSFLWRKMLSESKDSLSGLPEAIHEQLKNSLSETLREAPYLSCFVGFNVFFAMISFMPHGVGHQISGWLQASLADANVARHGASSVLFDSVCSSLLFIALATTFRRQVVRFSTGYQLFLTRLNVFRDGMFDAFKSTMNVEAIKIEMPDRHPHLHNALNSGLYVGFIYVALFSLVMFCPGPLGDTIKNYYQACLRDANFQIALRDHPNLLAFIASVVAAYATIPVAVMSCSFLPTKKIKFVMASAQGILTPCSFNTLFGISPIHSWSKLKAVTLEHPENEKRYLKLSFKNSSPIKLNVASVNKEALANLLSSADEYAKKCLIEKPVLELRQQLIDESGAQTMAESKRFSSTIFSLLKTGEDLRGTYRIVRKLAGKSVSAVYLARNAECELVVIKEFVLPDTVEACERIDKAFAREYKLLSELKHPSIAAVIESFEERGAKYIVIEHVDGIDFRKMVQLNGRRTERAVRAWAVEIAQALSYLHTQTPPVLHRDLTPDNLMLDENGQLKLIDFGASHQFIEGVTGTLIGKQCYIAPEQLRGKPSVESDVYSFGCTLYFLLTGTDPKALQQSDPQLPGVDVSPALRQLILQCTAFDPAERISSFADILSLLENQPQLDLTLADDGPPQIVEASYGH